MIYIYIYITIKEKTSCAHNSNVVYRGKKKIRSEQAIVKALAMRHRIYEVIMGYGKPTIHYFYIVDLRLTTVTNLHIQISEFLESRKSVFVEMEINEVTNPKYSREKYKVCLVYKRKY